MIFLAGRTANNNKRKRVAGFREQEGGQSINLVEDETENGPAELRGSGPGGLNTRIHMVIITPRNIVITVHLSSRVEFLALDLIRAEVRKAHEGFSEL